MRLDDGIRKHGFQRWYARELTQAHLHLLLVLLSAIGLLAAVELVARPDPGWNRLGNFALLIVCFGVSLWSLRRYFFLMMRAEGIAEQAVCPSCRTYGRLRLLEPARQRQTVEVSCKRCANRWQICDLGADP